MYKFLFETRPKCEPENKGNVIDFLFKREELRPKNYRGMYGNLEALTELRTAEMFMHFRKKYPGKSTIELSRLAADAVSSEIFSGDYQ